MLLPWLLVLPAQLKAGHGDWIQPPPLDAPLKSLFKFTTGWDFYFRTELVRLLEAGLFVPYLVVLTAGVLPSASDDERGASRRRGLAFLFAGPIIASYFFSLLLKPMYVIGRFEMIVFPTFALLLGRGFARVGVTLQVAVLLALGVSCALTLALFLGITAPI
jgi:hypothetical protein